MDKQRGDKEGARERFAKAYLIMWNTFKPDSAQNEAHMDAYWQFFKAYPIEQVEEAILQATVESEFLPKPKQIINILKYGGTNIKDFGYIQSFSVIKAVQVIGAPASIIFTDRYTMEVIHRDGGWTILCQTLPAYPDDFWHRRFVDAYVRYRGADMVYQDHHLPGSVELANRINFPEKVPEAIVWEDYCAEHKIALPQPDRPRNMLE